MVCPLRWKNFVVLWPKNRLKGQNSFTYPYKSEAKIGTLANISIFTTILQKQGWINFQIGAGKITEKQTFGEELVEIMHLQSYTIASFT